jgi:hypothetical protein
MILKENDEKELEKKYDPNIQMVIKRALDAKRHAEIAVFKVEKEKELQGVWNNFCIQLGQGSLYFFRHSLFSKKKESFSAIAAEEFKAKFNEELESIKTKISEDALFQSCQAKKIRFSPIDDYNRLCRKADDLEKGILNPKSIRYRSNPDSFKSLSKIVDLELDADRRLGQVLVGVVAGVALGVVVLKSKSELLKK